MGVGRRTPAPATAPGKVIVVGAGLAGLAAVYQLVQLGHDIRPRGPQHPGGRIFTLREPVADND